MRKLLALAVPAVVLLSVECASMQGAGQSEAILRPAEDAPSRFSTTDGIMPEDGCRASMVDPRDQTSIRLARSAQYGMSFRGDYEVELGRYGVRTGELLRVDCTTGEVLGIVRSG